MAASKVGRALLVPVVVLAAFAADLASEEAGSGGGGAKPRPMLEVGKVRVFRTEKRIEVDGRVAIQDRAIELFACCEGGKVHESVLVLDCKPSNLNLALLLLGFDDGGQVIEKVKFEEDGKTVEKDMPVENGPRFFGDPRKPAGERLIVSVRWTDPETKKTVAVRAEDMILDVGRQKPMRRAGWVFTGSRWVWNPRTEKVEFAADHTKTVMTTFHDPNTILENPLSSGGNDDLFHANSAAVPLRGTPVVLTITVPTPEERKAAEEAEAEEEKEDREARGAGEGSKSPGQGEGGGGGDGGR